MDISETPSYSALQRATQAHADAVAESGPNSPFARAALKVRIDASNKCREEAGLDPLPIPRV